MAAPTIRSLPVEIALVRLGLGAVKRLRMLGSASSTPGSLPSRNTYIGQLLPGAPASKGCEGDTDPGRYSLRAPSHGPSVHAHVLSRDPVSAVAGEERDHGGDLLRPAEAAEGRHRLEAGEEPLGLADAVRLGLGRAGRDRVDGDPP